VVLMSKKSSRGSLDVGLLYLDEEAPEDYRSSMGGISQQPGLWLNLLSDVMVFRWTFFDETLGDAGEWVELWEDPEKRPGIVRLELQFLGQGLDEKVESIFWIPNMINPEQLVQSNNQQAGGRGGQGGAIGGGGGGQARQGGDAGGNRQSGSRGGAGGSAPPTGGGRGGGR